MIHALVETNLHELKVRRNTAGKYARLYRLAGQDPKGFTKTDQEWLRRNFGTIRKLSEDALGWMTGIYEPITGDPHW
jgi:hypothetical protein